ncbi:MAG: hypothetical protein HYW77_02885 [Parcubacteria group bacterium]|nr:hypothetical protein [Parcubacteria group bacterium]
MTPPEFTQIPIQPSRPSQPPIFQLPPLFPIWWKKWLKWIVFFLLIVLVIVGILFFINFGAFKEGNVKLNISGPEEVVSGKEVQFLLRIENNNKVKLTDTKIAFFYPEKSVVLDEQGKQKNSLIEALDIDNLAPHEIKEFVLRAVLIGEQGIIRKAKAEFSYTPENIQSSFVKQSEISTVIQSIPIQLTVVAPPNVFPGQRMTVLVDYRNKSENELKDLKLVLTYPDSFKPDHFSPDPSEKNNIWNLDNLTPNQGDRISVEGPINGKERETKTIIASLQQRFDQDYTELYRSTTQIVIASKLIDLSVSLPNEQSNILQAGKNIAYKIEFSNRSKAIFSGLTLKAKLDGFAYDISSIQSNGFFDQATRTVTWSGAVVPELLNLPPGATGAANLTVSLKNDIPVGQNAIRVSATIETLSVPQGFSLDRITAKSELTSKVGTPIDFQTFGYYNDPSFAVNFGPIPPKVEEKTTYTIHWQIQTPLNGVNQAITSAFIPPGVTWENKVKAGSGQELSYNPITGQVVWRTSSIPPGSGTSLPASEAIFQISITPSINQARQSVNLIGQSTFQAIDALTNEVLNLIANPVNTNNIRGIGPFEGNVEP